MGLRRHLAQLGEMEELGLGLPLPPLPPWLLLLPPFLLLLPLLLLLPPLLLLQLGAGLRLGLGLGRHLLQLERLVRLGLGLPLLPLP